MSKFHLDEILVLTDVQADTCAEVLQTMAQAMYASELVKESYATAVIAREKNFATGLPAQGCGVAIPHTDIEHVKKAAICVGILRNEVLFGIMGEECATVPVKLVFMLAMNTAHAQLELLQNLMQLFQEESALRYLMTEQSKERIEQLVREKLSL